jgi:Ca-activated chloride channel family protein
MTSPHDDSRLTAYALGELDEFERSEVEAIIADDDDARALVQEIQATARFLAENLQDEAIPGLAPEHRQAIETRLDPPRTDEPILTIRPRKAWAKLAYAAGLIGLMATLLYPSIQYAIRHSSPPEFALNMPAPEMRSEPLSRTGDEVERIARESGIANEALDSSKASTAEMLASRPAAPDSYGMVPATPAPMAVMGGQPIQPGEHKKLGADPKPSDGPPNPGQAPSSSLPYAYLDNSVGRKGSNVAGNAPGGVGNYSNSQGVPQSQAQGQPKQSTTGGFAGGGAGIGGSGNFGGGMGGMAGGMGGLGGGKGGQRQGPTQKAKPGQSSQQQNNTNQPGNQNQSQSGQGQNQQPGQGQQSGQASQSAPAGGSQNAKPVAQAQPFRTHSLASKADKDGQPGNAPGVQTKSPQGREKELDSVLVASNAPMKTEAGSDKSFKEMSESRRNMSMNRAKGEAVPEVIADEKAQAGEVDNLRKQAKELDTEIARLKKLMPRAAIDARAYNDIIELRRRIQEQLDRGQGGDAFARIIDNPFLTVEGNPLSTFSIDVDTASYSNVRRFINQNTLPPKDAVRIEELINYFPYSYPQPKGDDPFSVNLEVARCPWDASHRLVRIGLKGREIDRSKRPPSNLVFLIDVSGSMNQPDKLPLLKAGMKLLVDQLGENDRVAVVVYAAAEGLALPSTGCSQKEKILSSLEELQPGGSTNGGRGIQLAYDIAVQNFIKGGTNRVILATDGDFNVGVTEGQALDNLIVEKRKSEVFLTVLGFGQGNVKHDKLESLADKGNGQYAYIDTIKEARKFLSEQISGTLVTIAKDVKIQVKFNPARAVSYRLIGYENRALQTQDFANDKKDAGEIGAGLCVTALYEVVPPAEGQGGEPVKDGQEILNVDLRYKAPDGDVSKLISFPALDLGKDFAAASDDYRFAASVAGFGMLLRNSPYKGTVTWTGLSEMARSAAGHEPTGYRQEFLELIGKAQGLEPR